MIHLNIRKLIKIISSISSILPVPFNIFACGDDQYLKVLNKSRYK